METMERANQNVETSTVASTEALPPQIYQWKPRLTTPKTPPQYIVESTTTNDEKCLSLLKAVAMKRVGGSGQHHDRMGVFRKLMKSDFADESSSGHGMGLDNAGRVGVIVCGDHWMNVTVVNIYRCGLSFRPGSASEGNRPPTTRVSIVLQSQIFLSKEDNQICLRGPDKVPRQHMYTWEIVIWHVTIAKPLQSRLYEL
ncbi:armadillo-type fold protein [Artemisia annua]|uniref:Armadillo-type fold protein n=1 Tax=Artemisia annua TaxID=35608 RepID=A0A2U1KAL3_ARTAN|nr:armadillo-type fold protein [Artemisia annua]